MTFRDLLTDPTPKRLENTGWRINRPWVISKHAENMRRVEETWAILRGQGRIDVLSSWRAWQMVAIWKPEHSGSVGSGEPWWILCRVDARIQKGSGRCCKQGRTSVFPAWWVLSQVGWMALPRVRADEVVWKEVIIEVLRLLRERREENKSWGWNLLKEFKDRSLWWKSGGDQGGQNRSQGLPGISRAKLHAGGRVKERWGEENACEDSSC